MSWSCSCPHFRVSATGCSLRAERAPLWSSSVSLPGLCCGRQEGLADKQTHPRRCSCGSQRLNGSPELISRAGTVARAPSRLAASKVARAPLSILLLGPGCLRAVRSKLALGTWLEQACRDPSPTGYSQKDWGRSPASSCPAPHPRLAGEAAGWAPPHQVTQRNRECPPVLTERKKMLGTKACLRSQ